jgi:hypothetical protein
VSHLYLIKSGASVVAASARRYSQKAAENIERHRFVTVQLCQKIGERSANRHVSS